MATFNLKFTDYVNMENTILEFGNEESHQQVAVDLEPGNSYETQMTEFPGRNIVRQGTIYYSTPGDATTAEGIFMWSYDTTEDGAQAAIIHWGDVNLNKMAAASGVATTAMDPEALRVLHERMGIRFHPHADYLTLVTGTVTP